MEPEQPPKVPKLIVVMTFDPYESGELQPVGEPM
jgi:hypothetical protein